MNTATTLTTPQMTCGFAIKMAGGRRALAEFLGVAELTTYHWTMAGPLPRKHRRLIEAAKPEWVKEWQKHQREQERKKGGG